MSFWDLVDTARAHEDALRRNGQDQEAENLAYRRQEEFRRSFGGF
jgi:hypothetical protein